MSDHITGARTRPRPIRAHVHTDAPGAGRPGGTKGTQALAGVPGEVAPRRGHAAARHVRPAAGRSAGGAP
ncbi:hypothetical protein GCM10022244_31200 [Streptomyces gulbargensis]|uniref:Uncharacterized protein n=1 Tax=Streptomyces gulbargensis TaxID=364901 RepID=A0ABP7MBU3_9ACTN